MFEGGKMLFKGKLFAILWTLALLRAEDGSQKCALLTAEGRQEIALYVNKLAKSNDPKGFSVTGDSLEKDSCYRKLEVASPNGDSIVFYLSPDQQFLFPRLFDLRVDPARAEAAEIARTRGEIEEYIHHHETPTFGPAESPITIAVFSDFQCPFCRQAMEILMKRVAETESPRIRIAYLHYPLPSHPWARLAAESLACFNSGPAFWDMHNFVFDHQSEITTDNLRTRLRDRLNMQPKGDVKPEDFTSCIESKAKASYVDEDIALGQRLGVQGTPTLFINGKRVLGIKSASDLQRLTTLEVAASK
jgi:glutaredoxin